MIKKEAVHEIVLDQEIVIEIEIEMSKKVWEIEDVNYKQIEEETSKKSKKNTSGADNESDTMYHWVIY